MGNKNRIKKAFELLDEGSSKAFFKAMFGFFKTPLPLDTVNGGVMLAHKLLQNHPKDFDKYLQLLKKRGGGELLIQEWVDPQTGRGLIGLAAGANKHESIYDRVLEWLIGNGFDFNRPDKQGQTPLMRATQAGSYWRVEILLNNAACQKDAVDLFGKTALHWAAKSENCQVFYDLIEKGCQVNIKDSEGETPLYEAVRLGSFFHVQQLMEHGADPAVKNKNGRTPHQFLPADKDSWTEDQKHIDKVFSGCGTHDNKDQEEKKRKKTVRMDSLEIDPYSDLYLEPNSKLDVNSYPKSEVQLNVEIERVLPTEDKETVMRDQKRLKAHFDREWSQLKQGQCLMEALAQEEEPEVYRGWQNVCADPISNDGTGTDAVRKDRESLRAIFDRELIPKEHRLLIEALALEDEADAYVIWQGICEDKIETQWRDLKETLQPEELSQAALAAQRMVRLFGCQTCVPLKRKLRE